MAIIQKTFEKANFGKNYKSELEISINFW